MDLNLLSLFVKLVDTGSFTKTAKLLRQPKSTVSRRLAALEKELAVSLLYRTTRQLQLTEAGRELYERCRSRIYELESSADQAKGYSTEVKGILKITVLEDVGTALMGPLLQDLKIEYPQLSIDLRISTAIQDLVKEGYDLAIRAGNLKDTSLVKRDIGQVQFILVASPEYLKKHPKIEKLADLANHSTLAFVDGTSSNVWKLKSQRKSESVKIQPVAFSDAPRILLELALADGGVTLLPKFLCLNYLKSNQLRRVLPEYATASMPIQFVWPAQKERNAKVRAFVDFTHRRLAKYFVAEF